MAFKLSTTGENFIKGWEALKLEAYQDGGGVWTIGWGHTATAAPGQTITKAKAQELFNLDVAFAVNGVNHYIGHKLQNQQQFDALVSLVYNLGTGNIFTKVYNNGYEKGSSLYNLLLLGNYEAAANRFKDFSKDNGEFVQGLFNRRIKEMEMFLSGKKKAS